MVVKSGFQDRSLEDQAATAFSINLKMLLALSLFKEFSSPWVKLVQVITLA